MSTQNKSKKMLVFGILFFLLMSALAVSGVYTNSPLDNPEFGPVSGKPLF